MVWAEQDAKPTTSATTPPAQVDDQPSGTTAPQQDHDALIAVLTDVRAGSVDRRLAAAELFSRDQTTIEEVLGLVNNAPDTLTLVLIAEAAGRQQTPVPADLPRQLWALGNAEQAEVRAAVAEAVGRHADAALVQELREVALDTQRPLALRQTALLALAWQRRTPEAAQVLVQVLESEESALHRTAMEAMGRMTGRSDDAMTRRQWLAWWEDVLSLPLSIEQTLLTSMQVHASERARQQESLQRRLVDAHRRLYLGAEAGQRSQMLVDMMGDEQRALRALAINLALQRLLDSQSLDDQVAVAVRERMDDPADTIRLRALLLLRDMNDAQGADRAVERFVQQDANDHVMVNAYLKLFARQPREQVIERIIAFLADRRTRADAAQALVAASDAGMLRVEHRERLANLVRRLAEENFVSPELVTLAVAVGEAQDWDWIRRWIDHPDLRVRQAAARVWIQSDQPLPAVAPLLSDETLEPLILAAVARRGTDQAMLRAVLDHEPSRQAAAEARAQAIVAMVDRVAIDQAIAAMAWLAANGNEWTLTQDVLSRVLARLGDSENAGLTQAQVAVLVPALTARAIRRLEEGAATSARSSLGQAQRALSSLGEVADMDPAMASAMQSLQWLEVMARLLNQETQQAMQLAGMQGDSHVAQAQLHERLLDASLLAWEILQVHGRTQALHELAPFILSLLTEPLPEDMADQSAMLSLFERLRTHPVNGATVRITELAARPMAQRLASMQAYFESMEPEPQPTSTQVETDVVDDSPAPTDADEVVASDAADSSS